jgi:anti-sigma factor RsiW
MHLTDEQLGAYADGELTAAEFSAARKHVDACAACAAEVAALEALTGKLAGALEPSPEFHARTLARLRAMPLPRAKWWRFAFTPAFRFSAAGAAVVALTAVGAYEAGYLAFGPATDLAAGPTPAVLAPDENAAEAAVADQADFLEHLDMLEDLDALEAMDDGVPG